MDFDNLAVETGLEGLAIEREDRAEMVADLQELHLSLGMEATLVRQIFSGRDHREVETTVRALHRQIAEVTRRLTERISRLHKLDPELQCDVTTLDFEAEARHKLRRGAR